MLSRTAGGRAVTRYNVTRNSPAETRAARKSRRVLSSCFLFARPLRNDRPHLSMCAHVALFIRIPPDVYHRSLLIPADRQRPARTRSHVNAPRLDWEQVHRRTLYISAVT